MCLVAVGCANKRTLNPSKGSSQGTFSHADMAGLKDYVGNWDLYSAKDFMEDVLYHARVANQRKTKHGAITLVIPKKVTFKDSTGSNFQVDLMTSLGNGNQKKGTLKDVFDNFLIKKGASFKKSKPSKDTRLFVVLAYMELAEAINKALNTGTPKQEVISKLRQALKDFKLKIANHVATTANGVVLSMPANSAAKAENGGATFLTLTVKNNDAVLTPGLSQKIQDICDNIENKINELEKLEKK
jgi:hypothetical protein